MLSLKDKYPEVALLWHPYNNGKLTPENIKFNSDKIVWWYFPYDDPTTGKHFDFEWENKVSNQVTNKGCPYLSGRKVWVGFNDLATCNQELAKEWDYEANGDVTPQDVTAGSNKKIWWKCSKGHKWKAAVDYRNKGYGCPYCSGRRVIIGETDLATKNPKLAQEWDYEANGDVTPQDVTVGSSKKIWWRCSKGHKWRATVADRNRGRDCPYCSSRRIIIGETDLLTKNPELAKEWDYEANDDVTPQDVTVGSGKKIWWRCSKGHKWRATVANRNNGNGCPYCSGMRVSIGETDLATKRPELAKEWDYEANGDVTPQDVTVGSNRTVWWKCAKGHKWKTTVAHRNNGYGCPYCSGRKVSIGETDLATKSPELAKEWDYEANGDATPQDVTVGSGKKIWWRCSRGHKWKATVFSRYKGSGCPYCFGRKVSIGETDLATKNPKLAQEWDYEANGNVTSQDVTVGSNKKIWWKCAKGHKWRASVNGRNKGRGCPYCSSRIAIIGETDLATKNPALAQEWDYEANGDVTPQDVTVGSEKKIWWKCSKGHKWRETVDNRNKGYGCPYCSGRIAIIGETDLATKNPALAQEWDYEKNGDVTPQDVTASSSKKIWWKCSRGHKWIARVAHRNDGHGCPYCSGRRAIIGETDLATKNPELAEEWDYEANGDVTPQDVTICSEKKIWWKCAKGHKWRESVAKRNDGRGCPYCSGRRAIIGETDLATKNPELAQEWDYEANGDVTPQDVTEYSHMKVWWKCDKGHRWRARICKRSKGSYCPSCR